MGQDGRPAWGRGYSTPRVSQTGRRSLDSTEPEAVAGELYTQKRASASLGTLALPHPEPAALKSALKKPYKPSPGAYARHSAAFPGSASADASKSSAIDSDSDTSDDVPLGVRQRSLSSAVLAPAPSHAPGVLARLSKQDDDTSPLTPPRAPALANSPTPSGRSSPASSVPSSPGRARAGAFRRSSASPLPPPSLPSPTSSTRSQSKSPQHVARKPLLDLSGSAPDLIPGGRKPLVDLRRDLVPESAVRAPGEEEDASREIRSQISPRPMAVPLPIPRRPPVALGHARSGSNMSVASQRSVSQGTDRTQHPPSAYSPLPPPFPPPWSDSPGSSAGGSVVSAKSSGSGSGSRPGPLTPRDGSDTVPSSITAVGVDTPPAVKSVAFAGVVEEENRRRDRRKSEARAAIELGNIVNGPGPKFTPEDMDVQPQATPEHKIAPLFPNPPSSWIQPMNAPYTPTFGNPMMGNPYFQMGAPPNPYFSPFLPPGAAPAMAMPPMPPMVASNPTLAAAHHQAMLAARQTFQLTMAQQAMAAAGEAWDLNLSVASGSILGTPSGSVYGGGPDLAQMQQLQNAQAQRAERDRRESMMSGLSGYMPIQQPPLPQPQTQQTQNRMSRAGGPTQASSGPRTRFAN
ncbi:hypothetical protein DACRYDRAFT_21756 [Dacryopinax primogenitus]|uniref:Uncharacterized protein n=1 Tax=Dacryopinax primogenitus (strain DJM 731) TaxID=1858805 RepID=M5GA39_DACPD|nr:uncharacterized protein DACRYDRAFT_21756 [Dacryopinax primogenitus]EJU02802.1 hypothetical protein DACRYDRAFT_21756 [Dacryopinax primogenitus]